MQKKKIIAKELIKSFDFFHLAKQFYKHIYRHPELEEDMEWKELKQTVEDYLVEHRFHRIEKPDMTHEDYRDFLRFYTGLEIKYEEPIEEFIFTDGEKNFFEKIIKKR